MHKKRRLQSHNKKNQEDEEAERSNRAGCLFDTIDVSKNLAARLPDLTVTCAIVCQMNFFK